MHTLARGDVLEVPSQRPAEITVLDGRVWLTRHKDATDYVLGPGESMHLPAGACAVVSALGAARMLVLVNRTSAG